MAHAARIARTPRTQRQPMDRADMAGGQSGKSARHARENGWRASPSAILKYCCHRRTARPESDRRGMPIADVEGPRRPAHPDVGDVAGPPASSAPARRRAFAHPRAAVIVTGLARRHLRAGSERAFAAEPDSWTWQDRHDGRRGGDRPVSASSAHRRGGGAEKAILGNQSDPQRR